MRMAEDAGKVPRQGNAATWITVPVRFIVTEALAAGRFDPVAVVLCGDAGIDIGRASVIDGDTIEIAGQRVRFNGIDAPESWQLCKSASGRDYRCGQAAVNALDAFLAASRPVRCEFVEWDRYRRFIGNCFLADGRSIQSWLVRTGHALDWPRYSKGAYAVDQAVAEEGKVGMWQGEFTAPWNARAEKRNKGV